MDLLVQLGLLTDMQFSCPTGITGSFSTGLFANDENVAVLFSDRIAVSVCLFVYLFLLICLSRLTFCQLFS